MTLRIRTTFILVAVTIERFYIYWPYLGDASVVPTPCLPHLILVYWVSTHAPSSVTVSLIVWVPLFNSDFHYKARCY